MYIVSKIQKKRKISFSTNKKLKNRFFMLQFFNKQYSSWKGGLNLENLPIRR